MATRLPLLLFLFLLAAGTRVAAAKNKIVEENAKQGSPSREWDINGAGDRTIQGFATDISQNAGDTLVLKIRCVECTSYRIDIYRMGYYAGLGARKVDTILPSADLPQIQPRCAVDKATHLVDCANWAESARWAIPSDAVSGLYFARLVRTDPIEPTYGPRATQNNWRADWSSKRVDWHHTRPGVDPYAPPEKLPHAYGALGHGAPQNALIEPRASHVYFVVRDDDGDAEILLQTSDATWQAYNGWGGLTTYGSFDFPYTHYGDDAPQPMNVDVASSSPPRAYKASYNRPLITRDYRAVNAPLNSEYPAIRFLESAGFSVSYFTDVDAARRGKRILQHKLFISVGHNEYASGAQRQAIEDARDAGVHLMFWSGNEFYWRIRFEDDFRTLVCYKESQSNVKLDPMGESGRERLETLGASTRSAQILKMRSLAQYLLQMLSALTASSFLLPFLRCGSGGIPQSAPFVLESASCPREAF